MRIPQNKRQLLPAEIAEVGKVFGNSLPSYRRIFITDGQGPAPGLDNPYTIQDMNGSNFFINVGPLIYPDLTAGRNMPGYGLDKNILIHEMTHVWQYYHGFSVVLGSIWANTVGGGYSYTSGNSWSSYNCEQQAQIVEDWYKTSDGNMRTTDLRFVYVDKIIRAGVDATPFYLKMNGDLILTHLSAAKLREV